jgi:hypothetical protein
LDLWCMMLCCCSNWPQRRWSWSSNVKSSKSRWSCVRGQIVIFKWLQSKRAWSCQSITSFLTLFYASFYGRNSEGDRQLGQIDTPSSQFQPVDWSVFLCCHPIRLK